MYNYEQFISKKNMGKKGTVKVQDMGYQELYGVKTQLSNLRAQSVRSSAITTETPTPVTSSTSASIVQGNVYLDGSGNSIYMFKAVACPSGTNPVAESLTDTLNLIAGTNLTITGDNSSDTITFTPSLTPAFTTASTTGNITSGGDVLVNTVGKGLKVKEGTNACMGVATLVAGTVTVSTTAVAATSRILLTSQNTSGTVGWVGVSARVAGTSFTITSSSILDTSDIAWCIINPL